MSHLILIIQNGRIVRQDNERHHLKDQEGRDGHVEKYTRMEKLTNMHTEQPAQRLMSRRTRSMLPCSQIMYKPVVQMAVTEQIIHKRKQAKY